MKKKQAERFFYELGTLLETGFPIFLALDMMEKPFRRDAEQLKTKLTQGQSLFDSMMTIPGIDQADAEVLRLAEETGRLSQAFLELHEMHRRGRELRQKLTSFAVYPILMLVLITAYLCFALFFMVPMMADLLKSLDVQEGFLFKLDDFRGFICANYPPVIAGGGLVIGASFYLMKKKNGALRLILGRRYRLYREVIAVDRMSKLLKGGRSILEVLDIAGDLSGIDQTVIREKLMAGESLSQSFSCGGFSKELTNLTRIHEEGGNLLSGFELFLKTSRNVINSTMEQRIKLLEPLSMVIIGAVVGTTVVSIMGPLMDAFGKIR